MAELERDAIVERVREATDIVEWIGACVELRPAGRDFKACCPFHREKTPSFVVSPEKQVFHCFGCRAGGDVFSFVMKHDGLSFPEALALLARRAGIALPEQGGHEGPDKAQLIAALREAVRFYRGKLKSREGQAAAAYLRERGMPERILDLYYVGYSPADGRALLAHMGERFPREALIQADLIGQSEEGRLYDRFRGRIMLPILGRSGEPIAFGARALKKEIEPKYLNSRQTAVYRKRGELFGLPQARQAMRASGVVLVVEGYFDVLSLASAGIHHAVAPCGTAWTAEHTETLLRMRQGQRIVFLFDGDAAGRAAAWRSLAAALPRHAGVALALLPPGKDPDDLVREGRIDELRAILAAPLTPVAFGMEVLRDEKLEGSALIGRITEMLASVGDPIAREMMIDEAAERSRLTVRTLRREVENLRSRAPRERVDERSSPGGKGSPRVQEPQRLTNLEELLLRQVQSDPRKARDLIEAARRAPVIRPGIRTVLAWMEELALASRAPSPPEVLRKVREELGEEVEAGFLLAEDLPEPSERLRSDLLRHLREAELEAENEHIGFEIRLLEQPAAEGPPGGRTAALGELLARKQTIAAELARLRARTRE
ncbi:MAG: DNA primase [Candidatus Eisenbacteria bacterium]|nr:DNA primase [Candidatus Eisenbacteria bacterium]